METLVSRACGLDVHRDEVTACVAIAEDGRKPRREIRRFRTFTADLIELGRWLKECGVTHVGMESTGVFWKPVYVVLEEVGGFTLIVGNAQHMKNVPGRKTDQKDAEWIAKLVQHGLVRPSYVPAPELRDLRDLVRYRRSLVNARSAERNRLQKVLQTANVKLASVASDVFGKSGMKMLRAMADGETDPGVLASLAEGLLRKKIGELRVALDGRLREHHRFMLRQQLKRLEDADAAVAALDEEIDRRLQPHHAVVELLCTIPGVDRIGAAALVAEIGTDVKAFPSSQHLAAWAGICPGNHESAGKSRSVKARKGNVHLRTALVEAAQAARNKRGSYLRDKYYRLKARRGGKRAIVAIAHKILVAAYHILHRRRPYQDLGEAYLDNLNQQRTVDNLVRRLERMGWEVQLQPAAA
jgi:transposase